MKTKQCAVFALCILSIFSVSSVLATDHVVISEVQIAGILAGDEFVELYNPTDNPVDLTGWRLSRRTQNSTTNASLVASMSGTIAPHGFFLVAHDDYAHAVVPDLFYSTSTALAANNSVLLYSDAGSTLVDLVGMGLTITYEASASAVPDPSSSIERKAQQTSTSQSMATGGSDETKGNSWDTDNNYQDFVVQSAPNPQNTSSPAELLVAPTPTPTPTPQPTPEPTVEPAPTPEPTTEPTPSPEPTAEPTPTPTPAPTSSPTPIPTNPWLFIHRWHRVCSFQRVTIRTIWSDFNIAYPSCHLVRNY